MNIPHFTIFVLLFAHHSFAFHRGINGGWYCAGCTFVVGVLEQVSVIQNATITETMERICTYLPPGEIKTACKIAVDIYTPLILNIVTEEETSDVICNLMHFCYTDTSQQECTLFPRPDSGLKNRVNSNKFVHVREKLERALLSTPKICHIPGIKWICDHLEGFTHHHYPMFDFDSDGFSTYEGLRGSSWRGRDCNDLNSKVHPGARPINDDVEFDTNCNGIYGVSNGNRSFEDEYCSGSGQRGVAMLGDSATAHFHFPREWANSSMLDENVFLHLKFAIENEFDWPMMSFGTGYKNITWPIVHGSVQSIYSKLRDRNLCNHRDYQNIAVNGADSHDLLHYQKSLSRRPDDIPLLVIYALVGNDVCNGYPDTLDHVTTEKEMHENIMNTLTFLNSTLPSNSQVLLIGLAQGDVMFKYMQDKIHPVGSFRGDVTYKSLYEFLTCLQVNPCNGWLTSNETLRLLTNEKAAGLSKVLSNVAKSEKFTQFDLNYMENPINNVYDDWIKKHGPGSFHELVEPVDGFHPNQLTNKLVAEYGWNYLQKHLPHYIGNVNPFNNKIRDIFGDQGGY